MVGLIEMVEKYNTLITINDEGGRDTHWVTLEDHGEASAAVRRRDVGITWGGRGMGGSGNAVVDDLHREATGNCGTVGGAKYTI